MKKTANYYSLQNNNKKSHRFISTRMLNIGLFLFIATGFFFYLIGISGLTAKGFILQDLRSQVAELEERHEILQQQVNSLQSFYVLNEKAKNLDMVKIDNIEYIKAGVQTVAKR